VKITLKKIVGKWTDLQVRKWTRGSTSRSDVTWTASTSARTGS
jgi:hypothetical protein